MDSPYPPLCSACQRIFDPGSCSYMVYHSTSHQERERSRAAGCWICDSLVNQPNFEGFNEILFYTIKRDGENSLLYRITFYGDEQLRVLPQLRHSFLQIIARRTELPSSFFDNAAKSRSCVSTGQPEVLQLALDWLKICQESHHCMARPTDGWHPSRLLDVSRDDSVRLVITADEQTVGNYATLSYCWGKDRFLTMTPNNISEFKAGRSIKDFPLTFREAFTVTKSLGIKYLWIDSYCIMQGDSNIARDDWDREAQQMCSVYTNSFLNIGSAHSDGPNGGLFHKHAISDWQYFIKWQPTSDDDELLLELEVDGPSFNEIYNFTSRSLMSSVMSTRAWIVQEIVLSPRMLTFTDEQLYWQCSESHACEAFPLQTSNGIDHTRRCSPFWVMESGRQYPPSNNGSASIELRRLRSRWFQILDLYFKAKLSYPEKDLLKALDGIGQRFAQLTGQAYWGGILEGTFPQALLWETQTNHHRDSYCELGPSGLAPSWHWASHKSASYFENQMYEPDPTSQELVLAHTFLWEDGMPFDSKTAKDAALNVQGPALICIGRLLKLRLADLHENGHFHPGLVQYPFDSISFSSIDAGKVDDFKNARLGELKFLPLLMTYGKIIEGVVICTDKHGFSKRVGYVKLMGESRNGDAFQRELLQEKPRLIFIE
ncbi:hypothetical protein PFICI_01032 [Pestalotiopsis fici W106-1]|uniref:Heterokaryon incompatibility domain-containing protein n=1 Tax=Pestalotiopsis fici (strain W106-1 / CGMCC3.15140) TaxID=1229662 RepID=W3XMI6_PESFW|nr:uncharacterized protein PFICI_01032 [Pestalotiopsis fici W106-1]ETS87204.1 hypothetical protein PFICI_01032 [Pestalotiopsis fici W106-1]